MTAVPTGYTAGTIGRALDAHARTGLIHGWYRMTEAPGFRATADLVDGHSRFEIRSLREAFVFVAGLASAKHAIDRDRQATLSRSCEEITEQIDAHCRAHGWEWRADLATGDNCAWQARMTVILTPDRQDGPDRSMSAFATGGEEPADVLARAWDDLRAWLASEVLVAGVSRD